MKTSKPFGFPNVANSSTCINQWLSSNSHSEFFKDSRVTWQSTKGQKLKVTNWFAAVLLYFEKKHLAEEITF